MTNLKINKRASFLKNKKGFTLMELVLVIIILSIMSIGISGFISLSTQTYVNATNRDELIGNARFVLERLTREIKNAVPNSIRVISFGTRNCIQFTPIIASTTYTKIPVAPESSSKEVSVIPFLDINGNSYQCDGSGTCNDLMTIYPLKNEDIYSNYLDASGKSFLIGSVDNSGDSSVDEWEITIQNADDVLFDEHSPTQRVYITSEQVSYCTVPTSIGGFMVRYEDDIPSGTTPPGSGPVFMAGYLISSSDTFNYQPASLKRTAVVQIKLQLTKDDENYVLNHEVHINNVP